jgi:predicted CoA-binding protein
MNSLPQIQDFLGQKRLALVGVSRSPLDISRSLFREFRQRGYDAVPVHPEGGEVDGVKCYARLQDVDPPVTGALLLTAPAATEKVVEDCAAAGIQRVWMYRGTGAGAVSECAVHFCHAHGIRVIAGECPFMFFGGGSWVHRLHGFLRRLSGKYPH